MATGFGKFITRTPKDWHQWRQSATLREAIIKARRNKMQPAWIEEKGKEATRGRGIIA